VKNILFFFVLLVVSSCKVQKKSKPYESENLILNELNTGVFSHISYLQTDSFGKVACNGMVVINNGEALVFDTPTDNIASNELINWLENVQKVVIKGVVITHFHDDCLGGITAFHKKEIPSYASNQTILLATKNNVRVPQNGFEKSMELIVGNHKVINSFMGEGHTKDNIVSYYPAQEALFGGCLVKTNGATKGYLGDANVAEWSTTVEKVKATYPTVKTVIPGHGNTGGSELLDYTIRLFKK
jgi:metallo-beta-lactamase class B